MPFDLNPQQQAALDWAVSGTGSLNLIARAGTGKTSAILEIAKTLSQRKAGWIYLGAFNKSIAEEIKAKLGNIPYVDASTMHSLGFNAWRKLRIVPKSEVEGKKLIFLAKNLGMFPYDKHAFGALRDAVSYAKQSGFGLKGVCGTDECDDTAKAWTTLLDYYDLWDEFANISPQRIIASCITLFRASLDMCAESGMIDFDDMILAPLYFGEEQISKTYDWVMGDEWQDSNVVRRRLMRAVLKPEGRAIFVGDNFQCIYGFAGAANDSLEATKAQFGCTELPLSVTYRCPKAVVRLANTWVPDIVAHESAPEGKVTAINMQEPEQARAFWLTKFTPDDVILCRNTRPLLGIAKRLRKQGTPCVVEGNHGRAMIALASKWGEDITIGTMLHYLGDYETTQKDKWLTKTPPRPDKAEDVQEKCAMLRDMVDDFDQAAVVRDFTKYLENMFGFRQDDRPILRLCSIHRSKGREWHRVFLIGRNQYMPSKYATQEWEIFQESCLQYVAVTRTKFELVEVSVPPPPKPEEPQWWEA